MNISEIEKLDYSQIVGIINERNRPSGGVKTVQEVCVNSFINAESNVLEIGSNTGFTTVNINLLTGAKVTGIDINSVSIERAEKYASQLGSKVQFIQASADTLPFQDSEFDLVWASNVTSFIKDKNAAYKEYVRVLKIRGYLALIPIYYIKNPPKEILNKVSQAIGVDIDVWDKQFWLDSIKNISIGTTENKLELIYTSDYIYDEKSSEIGKYTETVFSEVDLTDFSEAELEALKTRYEYFMSLFNENLSYCGYSVFIFQKRKSHDQVELFTSRRVV